MFEKHSMTWNLSIIFLDLFALLSLTIVKHCKYFSYWLTEQDQNTKSLRYMDIVLWKCTSTKTNTYATLKYLVLIVHNEQRAYLIFWSRSVTQYETYLRCFTAVLPCEVSKWRKITLKFPVMKILKRFL